MRNLLLKSLVVLLLVSCNEDEPTVDNPGTKVIGDHIYSLIQGDGQSGAQGSYLDQEIHLLVTDFTGNAVSRSLFFELSDESGSISESSFYSQDTIRLRWRLGCQSIEQTLKVIDRNVCGIAENACIDIEVFELTASADMDSSTGWIYPCISFTINDSYGTVASANDHIIVVENNTVYATTDPVGREWDLAMSTDNIQYLTKHMTTSGRFYYFYNGRINILDGSGSSFLSSEPPMGYLSNGDHIEMTSNEIFFYVSEYSSTVYSSTDGVTWTEYLNIFEETDNDSFRPQAIASDDDLLYIVTDNNYVLRINTSNNTIDTYTFPDQWSDSFLSSSQAQCVGANLFMMNDYDRNITVINMNTLQVQNISLSSSYELQKSNGSLFLTNNTATAKEWVNGMFVDRYYSYPDEDGYNHIGWYNGYPLLLDYENRLFLYND